MNDRIELCIKELREAEWKSGMHRGERQKIAHADYCAAQLTLAIDAWANARAALAEADKPMPVQRMHVACPQHIHREITFTFTATARPYLALCFACEQDAAIAARNQ